MPDLIELSGIGSNATYTTSAGGGGDIIGVVDNATYTDSDLSNSSTQINELNETYGLNGGTINIDGVEYSFELVVPDSFLLFPEYVTVTYDNGASSIDLTGDGGSTDVVFIQATPTGGGAARYFMAVDDSIGTLDNITSIETENLNFAPLGGDVMISLDQDNLIVVCFGAGTLIQTPTGKCAVEDLRIGDQIMTLDRGAQPIVWTHTQRVSPNSPDKAPIRIERNAMGPQMPDRPLLVSPQHRMLLRSAIVARVMGTDEILVPAEKLINMPGIRAQNPRNDRAGGDITYVHLFTGAHDIIFANGCPTETLLPDKQAMLGLPARARSDLRAVLQGQTDPARPILERGGLLDKILKRHKKNEKPLIDIRVEKSPVVPVVPVDLNAAPS